MAGATLKLPSLSIAFRDAGLDPRYQPAINVLAKSCTDFHAVLPAYLNARNVSGVGAGHFAISSDLQRKLAACADGIDAACRILRSPPAPHAAPKMTIAQFTQMGLRTAMETAKAWELAPREHLIAGRVVDEIRDRLKFLCAVGLDYLNLQRSAATL